MTKIESLVKLYEKITGKSLSAANVDTIVEVIEMIEQDYTTASPEEITNAVNDYLQNNPISGTTEEEKAILNIIQSAGTGEKVLTDNGQYKNLQSWIATYLEENEIGSVSEDEIAQMVNAYLTEHPIEDGAISENTRINGANLPILFLDGDTTRISKENAVDIKAVYVSPFKNFEGLGTLKWQGTSSLGYPKKNFTLKLEDEVDFGWGNTKKYCLKANYIDHSHARNIVSARLWGQVVQSRESYNTLPSELKNTPNNGAIDGFPIRVYVNGVYQGLYTCNIPKGKFMFNMDDALDNHCVLCGENFAGACFRASAVINGTDWSDEIHDTVPTSILTRWNEVISFVMNSTDEDFKANIDSYIDLQSLIDYYIFAYISAGLDSMGKNQIYCTYDGMKWYASMYDMDSTWGLYWNGSSFVSAEYKMQEQYESMVNGRQGNLLYMRLKELFQAEIETRYHELRNGVLSLSNILAEFEKFMSTITIEQYAEDLTIYTGIPSGTTNNIKQLRTYIPQRLAYVDNMIVITNAESISIVGGTSVYVNKSKQLSVSVKPSNANNYNIIWESDNDSVATVSDSGLVTGVGEGTVNITATDSVSGATDTIQMSVSVLNSEDNDYSEAIANYPQLTTYFDEYATNYPYFIATSTQVLMSKRKPNVVVGGWLGGYVNVYMENVYTDSILITYDSTTDIWTEQTHVFTKLKLNTNDVGIKLTNANPIIDNIFDNIVATSEDIYMSNTNGNDIANGNVLSEIDKTLIYEADVPIAYPEICDTEPYLKRYYERYARLYPYFVYTGTELYMSKSKPSNALFGSYNSNNHLVLEDVYGKHCMYSISTDGVYSLTTSGAIIKQINTDDVGFLYYSNNPNTNVKASTEDIYSITGTFQDEYSKNELIYSSNMTLMY